MLNINRKKEKEMPKYIFTLKTTRFWKHSNFWGLPNFRDTNMTNVEALLKEGKIY